jgi:alkylglycerol monooxygenase
VLCNIEFFLLISGTFEQEKTDENIAYGLVHPIQTFDPIYVQIFNYKYILGRFFKSKSSSEMFSVLFKGPGKFQK